MWPFTRNSGCATCGDDYTSSWQVEDPMEGVPVGLSYDTWWRTFGKDSGLPYEPDGPAQLSEEERQGRLWAALEHVVRSFAEQEYGASPAEYNLAPPAVMAHPNETMVGAFFYDPDLAKFGNAVSPFVQMDAQQAHLAERRRFEDRYDPKYFNDLGLCGVRYDPKYFNDLGLCGVQPCLYTDFEGNPTFYASGRPAEHIGGDDSADTTGKWLNADGSSNYPGSHALPRRGAGDTFVGWSQPPHPIDVVPSFDPLASPRDQARAVLLDYYHDDALRYWADNEAVKHCFIGGSDPRKENHDPALLIAAYENPQHQVWQCHGDKMTWHDLDVAVKQAIAHRAKLGPLPKSSYDSDPVVIYYYDNDRMKKITYPRACLPGALNPNQTWWWKDDWIGCKGDTSDAGKKKGLDGVHTFESNDPKAIADERANPGRGRVADGSATGGGNWGSEGVTWDKDMIGVMGTVVGVLLSVISTVLDMTGVGAVIGVPLQIATPFIVGAINAVDTAMHAGDFGAALDNLGQALIAAASQALTKGAKLNIPPEATKTLGTTIHAIAETVKMNSRKQLDYGAMWNAVNAKAKTFSKIGDNEAHALATMLGGDNPAGKSFIAGYDAGRVADPDTIAAIAKIMQAMTQFADPRVINLFLLGAGIGSLSRAQDLGGMHGAPKKKKKTQKKIARRPAPHAPAVHHTQGEFVGQSVAEHRRQLHSFVRALQPRYGLGQSAHVAGPASDPMVVAIQTLLNELWGFVKGQPGYLAITGVLTPQTKALLASFQQSYNVPPGDGTPNTATISALEAAVDDKRALQQHSAAASAASATTTARGEFDDPDYGPLARGCPKGTWWDSLTGTCRPLQLPLMPHVAGHHHRTRGEQQAENRRGIARAHSYFIACNGRPPGPGEGLIPDAPPGWDEDATGDELLFGVGAPVDTQHWYAPRSDGAFLDLIDELQRLGVALSGEAPNITARAFGALFQITHDVEGGVRIRILDHGPSDVAALWRHIDALMKSVGS